MLLETLVKFKDVKSADPSLTWIRLPPVHELKGVSHPATPQAYHLHWVIDINSLGETPKDSVWIIPEKWVAHPKAKALLDNSDIGVAITKNYSHSMAYILGLFDPRKNVDLLEGKYVGGSFIHKTAQIDEGVRIFPGAFVGAYCKIGKHSELRAHVVLEAFCQLGQNCLIHAQSILGADGFGFVPEENKNLKIPQIGNVVIGNDVEIGGLVTIDRATLGSTTIGEGTKMDNHCHVGHNSRLGRFGLYVAGFMCAGSVQIGDYFKCGGHVLVNSHVHIVDHVTIGGNSVITNDILESGQYVGYPLQPWKEGLRSLQNLTHLSHLRKDVQQIKKHLGLKD